MSGHPNILFFFADQQRWDTCGCYGQRLQVTPHLDRMAAEGVRFEHAFTCQPVCGPARASLQTGLYPTAVGCHTNNRRPAVEAMILAPLLRSVGYEVGYIGKWHLASQGPAGGPDSYRDRAVPPALRGGYEDFWLASDTLETTSHAYDGHMFDADGRRREFPPERYRADAQTDWAIEYLRSRRGDRPFFLFLSYIEPHHQNDHEHYEGPRGSRERFAQFPVPGDLEGTGGDWRQEYPDYLGCCAALDEGLGRIRAELDRLGLAENTLVIYTSDHGSHFRTRNSEYKRSCHDGCLRIPLVACGPGFTGGQVVRSLVSLIDLPPTILSAGGVAVPAALHGHALQPLTVGEADGRPDEVFAQVSESHVGRCLRTRRWKYSVRARGRNGWTDAASDRYTEDFLYDLQADPHERDNRVADPSLADVRDELAARLRRRMADAGEREPVIEPWSPEEA